MKWNNKKMAGQSDDDLNLFHFFFLMVEWSLVHLVTPVEYICVYRKNLICTGNEWMFSFIFFCFSLLSSDHKGRKMNDRYVSMAVVMVIILPIWRMCSDSSGWITDQKARERERIQFEPNIEGATDTEWWSDFFFLE